MEIDVLIFGAAAITAKADRLRITLSGASTASVRAVLEALREQYPQLKFALPDSATGRLAVNRAFAGPDTMIQVGDEVALVTLVGGG